MDLLIMNPSAWNSTSESTARKFLKPLNSSKEMSRRNGVAEMRMITDEMFHEEYYVKG